MNERLAFLTGSYAYGLPNEDSDVDLVVLMSKDELVSLLATTNHDNIHEDKYVGDPFGASLRYGNLNLIVTTNTKAFDAWQDATERCIQLAENIGEPITREEAIKIHNKFRRSHGIKSRRKRK